MGRGHQARREGSHRRREGLDDSASVFAREPHQQHEAGMPFDEGGNVRVAGPAEQVTFPLAGDGAVLRRRWALPDRHGVDDLTTPLAGGVRPLRPPHPPTLAKVRP